MVVCVSVSACRGLFAEFAESFSSSSAQRELFEPLSRYEQICREHVDVLQRLVSRSVPTHSRSADASLMPTAKSVTFCRHCLSCSSI